MAIDFFIKILSEHDLTLKIKHIQYNLTSKYSRTRGKVGRVSIELRRYNGFDTKVDFKEEFGSIINFFIHLDSNKLQTLNSDETISTIYNKIENLMLSYSDELGIDQMATRKIFENIFIEKFKTSIVYGKNFHSPDRTFRCAFRAVVTPTEAVYSVQVKEKNCHGYFLINFFEGTTDIKVFFLFFEKINFIGQDTFTLSDVNQEVFFYFDLTNRVNEVKLTPKYNSVETLRKYLSAFSSTVTVYERNALLGFPN